MNDSKEWDVSAAQLRKTHGYSAKTDYHKQNEAAEETRALAQEILRLARNTLLINLRFMESALVRFVTGDETVTATMATDGQLLYYNSVHICRQFKKAKELPARDYLHVVLHCVFRHLFVGKRLVPEIWDLACDVAVENIITSLNLKSLYCERQEKQSWYVEKLREDLPKLTAERLYRYFVDSGLTPDECKRLREFFIADDHQVWYKLAEKSQGSGDADGRDTDEDDSQGASIGHADNADSELAPPPEGEEGEDSPSAQGGEFTGDETDTGEGHGVTGKDDDRERENKKALSPEEAEQLWRDISQRISVELETLSNSYGENAGDFKQALMEVNREKYDYGNFLKRFAVLGENVEINDDEFDYIFYTYGMKLYGKMPLIEPLEYKEVKRVREFVIALDTSQSVAGELVQGFVQKTWNILKQTENFFTKVNVHILQCGARVEEDRKITSQSEFDEYMKHLELKGFGGTDFRPVFDHVNTLIKQHELLNLKGVIYFTDGYGTFPAQPPDYDAAFVFLDQGRDIPDLPVWAIKLVLTEDELKQL